jgi:hypothetical protein
MMVDELNTNKEMVHQILHEDLWKKNVCKIRPTHTDGGAETTETHHARASSRLV